MQHSLSPYLVAVRDSFFFSCFLLSFFLFSAVAAASRNVAVAKNNNMVIASSRNYINSFEQTYVALFTEVGGQ